MRRLLLLMPLFLLGCDEPPLSRPEPTLPISTGHRHDPASCGRIVGVVRWQGAVPVVPPLTSVPNPLAFDGGPHNPQRTWPNPNAPRVRDGRLAGAFVWLEGVEPGRSRPWDPTTFQVELRGRTFSHGRGLARVGDEIAVVSRDPFHHTVQARGAVHFGLALPEANVVRRRRLNSPGIVELRSGAGMYWARCHLLALNHPYMAVSDGDGRFSFVDVPDGAYRLVAWHPGWGVVDRERSPDTLRIIQVTFDEGPRGERPIKVEAGRSVEVDIGLGGGS